MSGTEGRENVPEMGRQEANWGVAQDKRGDGSWERRVAQDEGVPSRASHLVQCQHPGAIAQIFQVTGDLLRRILCLRAMRNAMMV